MPTEVFTNAPTTPITLSAAITSTSATSCSVSSASSLPSTGNFRLIIDSEILLVTAVSGTTLTIARGQEGTTAATHSSGATVTPILTAGALQAIQQASPQSSNTSNAIYTIDTTGGSFDVKIWHNRSGPTSYPLPPPTKGRHIDWVDQTVAIQTPANWCSFVPNAGEKINGSTGFSMSGTAYHFTAGSATVTATSSKFTQELYVGCSIASSNQAGVNYIVSAIGSDTSLTLATTFSGTTTTTATATRTSLLVAANGVRMSIDSDGTDWIIAGDGTPTHLSFTASSFTFIPPAGCTNGEIIGCGGGGGSGGGGRCNTTVTGGGGAGGGGGAREERVLVTWTPNTGYAGTTGAGGSAGSGATANNTSGTDGGNGSSSSVGSLATFVGASGGKAGGALSTTGWGGTDFAGTQNGTSTLQMTSNETIALTLNRGVSTPGAGGQGQDAPATAGNLNRTGGFAAGAGGSTGTTITNPGGVGGGGGGAGPRGAGGAGGAGGNGSASTGSVGSGGSSPSANTGAGAGGGGGGGAGTTSGNGGAGNTGGSGYVDILYTL